MSENFKPNLPEKFGYYWVKKDENDSPRMLCLYPAKQYKNDKRSLEAWTCPGIKRYLLDAQDMPAWQWEEIIPSTL